MSRTPAISVVMPAYNAAATIGEAIESILTQTFHDFEIVIIDDGSTDDTAAVVQQFTDPRIRMVRNKTNRGLAAALNLGLDLATAPIVARMDADDRMYPERLDRQLTVLRSDPGITAVASFADVMNMDGEITGVWDTDRAAVTEDEIRRMMPRTNCIVHSTMMFRKAHLKDLRYAGRHEDWDLWLRMLSAGLRIVKIPEPLLALRMHSASFMGAIKKGAPTEIRLLRSRWEFLSREWRRGRFSRLHIPVLGAQARTLARHLRVNVMPRSLRAVKRTLTYSPFKLLREEKELKNALENWDGRQILLFPHMRIGGAELVHARIAGTIADQKPLIIIHGFPDDGSLRPQFEAAGQVIVLPRLLNHPLRRKAALEQLAGRLNGTAGASLFGSLSGIFFDLIPLLNKEVRTIYLQHAFLHQPGANLQHKEWLAHYARVDTYVFIAMQAMEEFQKFLFANNVPKSSFHKLNYISNATDYFEPPQKHDRTGLLFVGRNSPEKRAGLFIRIAKELHSRAPGRCQFSMVGPPREMEAGPAQVHGMISDPTVMRELYRDHDLLLVTSYREGFPMVIMEAMAMGMAVFSTPVGDVPLRLTSDTSIITSSVDEDVVVREMVEQILSLSKERLEQMRRSAYEFARKEFNGEHFTRSYRELLNRPAASR